MTALDGPPPRTDAAASAARDAVGADFVRGLFEHSSDCILLFRARPGGAFVCDAANPAAERTLGRRAAELTGRAAAELLPPDVARRLPACVAAGRPDVCEHELELPAGRHWFSTELVPLCDPGRSAERVAAVARDLTAHRKVEAALRTSEERFAKAFHATSVARTIARLRDRRVIEFNDAWLALTGLTRGQVSGRSIDEMGLWINPAVRADIYRRLWEGVPVRGDEVRLRLGNGEERVGLLSAERIDLDGEPCGLWSFQDITERTRAEEEVRRLNRELERRVAERTAQLEAANGELEAFAYSVSHDLRAPLRAIDGFSKALLEDYHDRLDESGQDFLRRVRAASQRMGELIDDLLMLSRVSRGTMRVGRVDLSAVAGRVVAALRQGHPERHVEVAIAPGLTAEGDANLLRVVLENLLGNAWKYTGGKPHARIQFGLASGDGSPAFCVRDNGAGFDPAYAHKLFQPFQRLHRADEFEGHGIGLATVQRIVHRHGGRVWADGAPGVGAAFYFSLPGPDGP